MIPDSCVGFAAGPFSVYFVISLCFIRKLSHIAVAAGREVAVLFEGQLPAGISKHFLDAAPLVAGAYVLTLEVEGRGVWSQRLMVR